jgi:hypothetical protein
MCHNLNFRNAQESNIVQKSVTITEVENVNLSTGEWKQSSTFFDLDTKWAPEPVWTLWRRENLTTAGNITPAFQFVARCYSELSALAIAIITF